MPMRVGDPNDQEPLVGMKTPEPLTAWSASMTPPVEKMMRVLMKPETPSMSPSGIVSKSSW